MVFPNVVKFEIENGTFLAEQEAYNLCVVAIVLELVSWQSYFHSENIYQLPCVRGRGRAVDVNVHGSR